MRSPTPPDKVFGFFWRAIAGERQPVFENEPQAGWWKLKLKSRCCWVPVKIWLVQEVGDDGELLGPEIYKCTVDGAERDPIEVFGRCCRHPIEEHEFLYMTALRAWQRANEPEAWDPYRPIDMTETTIER